MQLIACPFGKKSDSSQNRGLEYSLISDNTDAHTWAIYHISFVSFANGRLVRLFIYFIGTGVSCSYPGNYVARNEVESTGLASGAASNSNPESKCCRRQASHPHPYRRQCKSWGFACSTFYYVLRAYCYT